MDPPVGDYNVIYPMLALSKPKETSYLEPTVTFLSLNSS